MRIFICTAGTSIATNKNIDIKAIENKPSSEKEELEIYLTGLRQQVEECFSRLDFKRELDRTSAEIKSLSKVGLEKGDRIYLLVSDTVDGQICATLNKKYLTKCWDCEVILEQIPGLQPLDSRLFRHKGLKNFLEKIIHLLEKHQYKDVYLNITAGYKSVVPYITLLGMIHDRPIKYVFEKSNEVLTLEKIPVKYDEETILDVEDKLVLIEKETEIKREIWEEGIPFEKRGRYASLIQESRPGYVTMSEICFIFYGKFKIDYPPELERDNTPHEKKRIRLRDDHGKDTLMDFAKRITLSPFVREVVNSLPYNPGQTEPIKKCHDDGKIEIVLPKTDRGLGLVVQSTGHDIGQTESIADLLKKKYFGFR